MNFMKQAFLCANRARQHDDVPIGAVIVRDGKIIARGENRVQLCQNPTMHAEIVAIDEASRKLGGWRLMDCTLYVTLEPCPMCAGAIINSRIKRVVFGAFDPKAGSCGSLVNLFELPYNHKPKLLGGVRQEECSGILSEFFKA